MYGKSRNGSEVAMGNPFLEALEFDGEREIISFKGVRYSLLHSATLVYIASRFFLNQ